MKPVTYLADSPSVQALLNGIAERLPREVQNFALDSVCFIAVGEAHGHGQTWNKRYVFPDSQAEWVVVLSEEGLSERVVAHEIAHAWSNHGAGPKDDEEAEAERLATEWGF